MKLRLVSSLAAVLIVASCMEAPITQDSDDDISNLEPVIATQEKVQDIGPVYEIVSEVPVLRGGMQQLMQKINYPSIAVKAGVEGRVFVSFVIDQNGDVKNAQVIRGIGAGCDEEALRVIRQAKFEPGRQNGKAVNVKMSMPVMFKLQ